MFICKDMNTDSEGGIRLIRSLAEAARLSHDVRLRSFIRMFTPQPMSMVVYLHAAPLVLLVPLKAFTTKRTTDHTFQIHSYINKNREHIQHVLDELQRVDEEY